MQANLESAMDRRRLKVSQDNWVAGVEGSERPVRAICAPFSLGTCNVRV